MFTGIDFKWLLGQVAMTDLDVNFFTRCIFFFSNKHTQVEDLLKLQNNYNVKNTTTFITIIAPQGI